MLISILKNKKEKLYCALLILQRPLILFGEKVFGINYLEMKSMVKCIKLFLICIVVSNLVFYIMAKCQNIMFPCNIGVRQGENL